MILIVCIEIQLITKLKDHGYYNSGEKEEVESITSPVMCCVVAVVLNTHTIYSIQLQQNHVWPNENRDGDMVVCVTDIGFKIFNKINW